MADDIQKAKLSENDLISEISYPLYKNRVWLRVLALPTLICGIFIILTSMGLSRIPLIGILFLIVGSALIFFANLIYSTSKLITISYETSNKEALLTAIYKLGTYFKIMGILTVVGVLIELYTTYSKILFK